MEETTLTKTKYLHRFLADADIRLVRFGFLQVGAGGKHPTEGLTFVSALDVSLLTG